MSSSARNTIEQLLTLADVKINGHRPWDIQIKDDRFYARVLKDASLGLGESFMDGWWTCEALDQLICQLLKADLESKVKKNGLLVAKLVWSKLVNQQTKSRAKEVADVHYNLDNELYGLMLGKTMSYTCAYFKNTDSLDVAQDQKHELICRKLDLKPTDTVLEMGCGWGGFAEYAAKNYRCKLLSVNISTEQIAYAKERCKGLDVTFHLCDYRDHHIYNPQGIQFDKAVSIGMCEHVGYKNYRGWLELVDKQLKSEGMFLLHTIGGNVSTTSCEPWTQKYIFPNGQLPSVTQLAQAMEGLFVMEDWHNFGPYYDKTLMAWHHNFVANWDKLKHRYDDRFYRMWTYYLLSCAGMFRARDAGLWQIVMSKGAKPGVYESVR
jgi:cyclopropane-fatty-acyl-phospholipid synthase